ncbi:uncharacterized protein TEOVI_000209200 [Trypanosoma equiperdum]|uniref:Uncharacterized protein n=1 Tax=Trypanosoma equiperdum TaxID=5694 RepID=A0A1G4IDV1_TRYEQ|nr:hypothetical protein, conserved [Trypanosoma equiperdum]
MVTLRYLRSKEEAEARRARLEEARRIANQIGVQRARTYAAQKREQARCIMKDLRTQWLLERQRESDLIDRMLYEAHARQGEGMKGAANLEAHQHEQAINELSAWGAEYALERERHKLALEKASVTRALQQEPQRRIIERKKAVRAAEEARAKVIVSKREKRSVPGFTGDDVARPSPLAGAYPQTMPTRLRKGKTRMEQPTNTVEWPAREDIVEDAAAAAAHYLEERQRAIESNHESVERKRREAAERAASLKRKQEEEAKHAEEEMRRREKNLLALKQHATEGPRTEEVCTRMQDTRRSVALKSKGEAEFEAIFLRDTLGTEAKPRQLEDSVSFNTFERLLQLSTISSLLPTDADIVAQLPTTSLCVFADEDPEQSGELSSGFHATKRDSGDHVLRAAAATDDVEVESHAVTPTSGGEPPLLHPLKASEEVPPHPTSICDHSVCDDDNSSTHTGSTDSTNKIEERSERREQFLTNLKLLQARLERAMGEVPPSNNPQGPPSQTNVTVSSMSSISTPPRREGGGGDFPSEDYKNMSSEGTSDVSFKSRDAGFSSASSAYTRTHPTMTAEQLKAALLRMKLRLHSEL